MTPLSYRPLGTLTLRQPAKLMFGCGCLADCANDLAAAAYRSIVVVTSPPVAHLADPLVSALRDSGASVLVLDDISAEPTVEVFENLTERTRTARPDAVVGLGAAALWTPPNSSRRCGTAPRKHPTFSASEC
jgi:alcohol dehydrogenase class IV